MRSRFVSVRSWLVTVRLVVVVVIVLVMSVDRSSFAAHIEFGRADAAPHDRLRPDGIWRDREASQCGTDVLEPDARIDESTENHVAGGTGETVKVENGQDLQSYSSRTPPAFTPASASPPLRAVSSNAVHPG